MKLHKNILLSALAVSFAMLFSFAPSIQTAKAMDYRENRSNGQNSRAVRLDRNDAARIRIVPDRNRFSRQGLMSRYPRFRTYLPSTISARTIILVDVDNPNVNIVITNPYYGTYSISSIKVFVDHDAFIRMMSRWDRDRDVHLDLDMPHSRVNFRDSTGAIVMGNIRNMTMY